MKYASSNLLALVRWHGLRHFHDASQNQIILLVLGGMAILAVVVWQVQRRRRRWF